MDKKGKFRFRKLDNIGAADAEEDKQFLEACFVETGQLEILRDCRDPRRIILGRTGSGKTALIQKMVEIEERTIEVKPESLALSYISNSTILNFVSNLGVKLDIFFKLLWRHVFTVELIKFHFGIQTEDQKFSFLSGIKNLFKDKKNQKALEYLENWGKSFWEETEYRIKELTTNLENSIESSIKGQIPEFSSMTLGGAQKLTEEQKKEVIQRAQHVVNQVQIRQLSDIIELIDKVLDDPQKHYYITIDRLDEDWIEERVRYRLIRALIETVRDFRKVRFAKLIVAIRHDLLRRVIRLTRDPGFQEEKLESLYLPLEWNKPLLVNVLNSRVNCLVRKRYTKGNVTYRDIMPDKIRGMPTIDYVLERTLMRPRDIILFFNKCISYASDRPSITAAIVKQAEGEYSKDRIRALADEWYADYPNFIGFAMILKGKKKHFLLKDLKTQECEDFCLDFMIHWDQKKDPLSIMASQVIELSLDPKEFRKSLFQIFYRIGLVGLKLEAFEGYSWIGSRQSVVASAEIDEKTRVAVHPAFYRVLGISE